MPARIAQLRHLGCKSVVPFLPLYWKFSDTFLPHYLQDLPHRVHLQADRVRQGFRLMTDDVSRREYLAQLRFRLLGDFGCLPEPVQGGIYFREDMFRLGEEETLVDCGAFDGDTLSLFLDKTGSLFKSAIAFEPDPANYARLAERVDLMPPGVRRRIAIHQSATGESNVRVLMDAGHGESSHIGNGDLEVECAALDSILRDVPVTFIKMDIEGAELATLAGAQRLIQQNAPIMAICAYHRQDDLWNIPLFIHGLNPDYSFHLRPHLLEGWDLVCYAIPSNRCL
jgi:FkbM family methyltransferase